MSNDVQILSETKWLKSISFPGVMRVAVSLYYDDSSVSLQLSNARHLRPYFQPVLMSQDILSTSANLLGNLSGALLVRTCRFHQPQHGSFGHSHRILGPWGSRISIYRGCGEMVKVRDRFFAQLCDGSEISPKDRFGIAMFAGSWRDPQRRSWERSHYFGFIPLLDHRHRSICCC